MNILLVDVAQRVVEGLSELHLDVPAEIPSWNPAGTEAQRLGLALHLPRPGTSEHLDEIQALVHRWGFDGFVLDDDPTVVEFRFTLTPDDAKRLNDEAIAARLDRLDHPEVSGPSVRPWPGDRDLADGDTGADVDFLRLVLNAGEVGEPVDEKLRGHVRGFQARRGAPVTGAIDVHLWRRILPERRPSVVQGDTGFIVRVVQAALIAYEGASSKVTGTWGVLTNRDVYAMQDEYNLQRRPAVRDPEWAILLGPVNPRVEEARRAAKGQGVPELHLPAEEVAADAGQEPAHARAAA